MRLTLFKGRLLINTAAQTKSAAVSVRVSVRTASVALPASEFSIAPLEVTYKVTIRGGRHMTLSNSWLFSQAS